MNEQPTRQYSIWRLFAATACCAGILAISVSSFGRSPVASLIVTTISGCLGIFIVLTSPTAWLRVATPTIGAIIGFFLGQLLYLSPLLGAAYGILTAIVILVATSLPCPNRRLRTVVFSLSLLVVFALLPFGLKWRHNVAEAALKNAGIRFYHAPKANKRFGTGLLADLLGPYVVPFHTTLVIMDGDSLSKELSFDATFDELGRHFGELQGVDLIHIESDRITNEAFAHVARVPGVHDVQIVAKQISTESLQSFKNSPTIDTMLLRCPQVDDSIVDILHSLPKLKDIYLDETMVSDEAVRRLASFPRLKFITVPRSATDETVSFLRNANKAVTRMQHVP